MIGKVLRRAAIMSLLVGLLPLPGFSYGSVQAKEEQVKVWLTTKDQTKLLNREPDLSFEKKSEPNELTINVNDRVKYQQMEGFGASMTDSSAWLIESKLSSNQRNELMESLFDHEKGIGISYVRLPMGASDFSLENYTYDDVPQGQTDPKLKKFSIDHDSF